MSSPGESDFFELQPEHENPLQPGNYVPQWEGRIAITKPNGERSEQLIRVPREPGDTDQDVRIKMALAMQEIQNIIAERGGDYDVTTDLTDVEEI